MFESLGVAIRTRVNIGGLTSACETMDMAGLSQKRRRVGPMDMNFGSTFSATSRQSSPRIARIHRLSIRAASGSQEAGSVQHVEMALFSYASSHV